MDCSRKSSGGHLNFKGREGVITPNKIPLTTIVTYLQKCYRSRISNHWATISACSVVPPIYKQSKKLYCLTGRLQWQPSDSHKMSVAIFTPIPDNNKWQLSLHCVIYSSDHQSYWIHRVNVKVSAQVTTVTYMHQSQPSLHLLLINSDLAITKQIIFKIIIIIIK